MGLTKRQLRAIHAKSSSNLELRGRHPNGNLIIYDPERKKEFFVVPEGKLFKEMINNPKKYETGYGMSRLWEKLFEGS